MWRGVPVAIWLYLNTVLAGFMVVACLAFWRRDDSLLPPIIYAVANTATTIASYYFMRDFYFSI